MTERSIAIVCSQTMSMSVNLIVIMLSAFSTLFANGTDIEAERPISTLILTPEAQFDAFMIPPPSPTRLLRIVGRALINLI